MRHQETIYIQNQNSAVRNKDILNVNMSSDFCVFSSPTFDIYGTTKIPCNTLDFTLTGYTFTAMLSSAYTSCFVIQSASTGCYVSTDWETVIYNDGNVVYSGIFYTTTSISGDTPNNLQFANSISKGFDILKYDYIQSGTTFNLNKPYGVKELMIDVCINFNGNNSFSCPAGYSATPSNDACQQIIVTGATYNGSGGTISAGDRTTDYSVYGAYFYPNVSTYGSLPVYYTGDSGNMLNQTGGTITPIAINSSNNFWASLSNTSYGRLNNVGLSASTTDYLGFTQCIDVPVAGTYYVGMAADNYCKFTINGVLIANFSSSTSQDNFRKWSVFQVQLNSGKNIIEIYGKNAGSSTAFGAEIYNPSSFAVLTGATGTTQAGIIFSTANEIGQQWTLGGSVGYSCPSGYALDGCGSTYTCTKISTTGFTGCTVFCTDACTNVVDEVFSSITNTNSSVYLLDNNISELPIVFKFNNTLDTNTRNFKYEVYKFDEANNIFVVPPVYKSPVIPYSQILNNTLQQQIPISSLNIDGDYLIKGYFESNVGTTYLNMLGKTIDTSYYKSGSAFQLYEPTLDHYFIAIQQADIPIFNQTNGNIPPFNAVLPLYQQAIIVNDAAPSGYTRTGSTFTLNSEYTGDIIVTLNGLVLAKNHDYTLSGTALTFVATIHNGDVITIAYTRTTTLSITSENLFLGIITSGTTNNQGSNRYYHNNTTGKYEIYTSNNILNFTSTLVMVNGVTLTNQIDFYQSTTNNQRIILNGIIMSGDIITMIYYPQANVINGIIQTNNLLSWSIANPPQANNGAFNIQFSTGTTFSSLTVSDTIEYQPTITTYTGNLALTGSVGTNYYYRVQNIKNYRSICGDIIQSTAYSETVGVKIQSNAINSY